MDDQLIDKFKNNPEVTNAFLEGVVIGRRVPAAEGSTSRANGRHTQSQQAHVQHVGSLFRAGEYSQGSGRARRAGLPALARRPQLDVFPLSQGRPRTLRPSES
ncbi:hypothetical protein QBC46DRAFT_403364 [Diplogelasinospora grovesii]|uniref:Uncharacterized protein n=1 Tax=Diplogelasinospora grovesii TaxID=303347 RepID=A0AAN6NH52_9PEZI|nr:hypothetical protein QBC46DRAFT_403364 [Diplogelasinospora grovesii]